MFKAPKPKSAGAGTAACWCTTGVHTSSILPAFTIFTYSERASKLEACDRRSGHAHHMVQGRQGAVRAEPEA